MSTFEEYESKGAVLLHIQRAQGGTSFWKGPRRRMMDAFVKAWRDEAREAVRRERQDSFPSTRPSQQQAAIAV